VSKLQGVDVFGMEPIKMTRAGTTSEPIKIESLVSSGDASWEREHVSFLPAEA
jgi:hypothetical protein